MRIVVEADRFVGSTKCGFGTIEPMDQQAECSLRIIKVRRLRSLASLKPSSNVFSKKSDLLQSKFLWRYQIDSFRPDINAHHALRQESVSRQGIQSKTALKGFPVERKRHVGMLGS